MSCHQGHISADNCALFAAATTTHAQLETWSIAPIGAAVLLDTIAHSIPGLNVLLSLLAEPLGAAAGVAYLMTLVLSSEKVDPKTLAPEVGLLWYESLPDEGA